MGQKFVHLSDQEIGQLKFQPCRKKVSLRVRPLTQEDHQQLQGHIQTLEGPISFQTGDYLVRGQQSEEWPVTSQHLEQNYQKISGPDQHGFLTFQATDIREASQIAQEFSIAHGEGESLRGKAGDYLVRSGDQAWIVDREIFEQTYEPA